MQKFDNPVIRQASARHPKPPALKFSYGTAGFRMKATLLDSVIFRTGILAVLRSKKLDGKVIGIMITASHNAAPDNGVKLIDPLGEMIEQSWETYATDLANAEDEAQLIDVINRVITINNIDITKPAKVVYARDTRPSGPALIASLEDALKAMEVEYADYGLKTTPQLHYIVRCLNTAGTPDNYGEPTEEGYYKKLATAYRQIVQGKPRLSSLIVDCANGVGAPKLRELIKHIGEDIISVRIVNDDINSETKLNHNCGADYVKSNQAFPEGFQVTPNDRCAALDGDADRIVYFFTDSNNHFKLLDGDKIAGLASMFIMELVKASGIDSIKVGVVQTAYANGSSTHYLSNTLQVPVSCVATGVKHLHHEATKYDIGVYFEANGHGTVLFNPQALHIIRTTEGRTPAQETALKKLRALTELINQTVGDALSDLLLVEAILTHRQWSLDEWNQAYTDLPNRLVKVKVADRHIFKTTNAERQLVEPVGLQAKIDELVAKYNSGRSFVRPSGTEDVVRVYAEAATRSECDDLAFRVAGVVYDYAGGVGGRPKEFL
ncbi:uncharacterized protein VTP21DRAFT_494 [Calcarisporiella thermophila]|uniref:uncharacterized protein n=1 Tax=Calcarisporiella thermophila TaxID=911321 RepID=UPI0037441857